MEQMNELFRALPSVDVCLNMCAAILTEQNAPRSLGRDLVNAFLETQRQAIRQGTITDPVELSPDRLRGPLGDFVRAGARPRFRRVLNATGVIVHTNLGRSVLAEEAVEAVQGACCGYSNLEFDLEKGERGSRYSHVESLLCRLTGAEAALVVNNNAAAVLVTLDSLCAGGEVIIARGQLVEIGGSFRIPEVMARSGAFLREVGCTNRVHPRDYEEAITERTSALMRVHTSNYRIIGFHGDVSVAELAALAERHSLPLIEDLGSGSLLDFTPQGLPGEPTVRSVVAAGAHVVTFSGDKVLGGPQAGIIVGKRNAIDKIRKNPLNRALRIDKMTLAALEATLRLYLDEDVARNRIPTLRMITASPEEMRRRAGRLVTWLKRCCGRRDDVSFVLAPGESRVGGGSFPEHALTTVLVRINSLAVSPEQVRRRLLAGDPPLVGRLEDGAFLLDPRTLPEDDIPLAARLVAQALFS